MGAGCCKIPTVATEVESEVPRVDQEMPPGAGVLLPTSKGPVQGKQAYLRDIVAARVAQRQAVGQGGGGNETGDFASLVRGLGLTFQLDRERRAISLEHRGEVAGIAFSPDGRSLLVGGEDETVVLWDVPSQSKRIQARASGAVTAVAFALDGSFFAAGDEMSCCTVWRASTMDKVATLESKEGRVLSVALCSWPRPLLAVSLASGFVRLLSLPGMQEEARLKPDGLLHGICFSPQGGLLAGGCGATGTHGLASIRPTRQAKQAVQCWRLPHERGGECKAIATLPFEGKVRTTVFSPSGRLLAAGSEDRTARTFLVDKGFEQVACLPCPAGVWCLAWTSDSRFLVSGGEDMQVSVWDLISERIVLQLPRMEDWLCAVAVSPTGDWLACSFFDGGGVSLHPVEVKKVGGAASQRSREEAPAAKKQELPGLTGSSGAGLQITVVQHP
mmetsp:Transcript_87968/g.262336  ORF Transcript_87968/g.262336 Transcript_87968/m.262336 type:complete len:445 (+) Transcript_87968:35-1369(+)